MLTLIRTPKRISILLLSVFMIAVTTAFIISHVNANQQGGYAEDINADGSGWRVRWLYNEENTASATTSVSKWKVWNGTRVSATAGVSATSTDSTGVQNEGAYFMTTNPYRQMNGDYEGNISKAISRAMTDFFKSPHGTSGTSFAEVDPDRDSSADPGTLRF